MRNRPVHPSPGNCLHFFLILQGALVVVSPGRAVEALPFDPAKISRLSVDNIPRSISIRQGSDVWLGYDLEKALVFKVWQATKGKPGVILKGFKAESAGTALFEKEAGAGWQMKAEGKEVALTVRYLGCTQNNGHFALRWELSHPDGSLKLTERIPTAPATGSSRASRQLRVESLEQGASLILPSAYGDAWLLTGPAGKPAKSISGSAWHTLSLR